jgi:DNA-binding transcriptional regulator YiaG
VLNIFYNIKGVDIMSFELEVIKGKIVVMVYLNGEPFHTMTLDESKEDIDYIEEAIKYNVFKGGVMMLGIKLARLKKKMTQQQLADSIDVSVSSVRAWEQGVNEVTIENLKKLTKVLECTADELLKEEK